MSSTKQNNKNTKEGLLNVIRLRNVFVSIAAVVIVVTIALFGIYGFRLGVDFIGGTLWQFELAESPAVEDISSHIAGAIEEPGEVQVSKSGDAYIVRMRELAEPEHRAAKEVLSQTYGEFQELSFQSIGPSIGEELRNKSLLALVFALLGISLYIAFAFRKVYRPVSSWKYGIVTLVTLAHDVAVPTALLVILGQWYGVELDGNFVVALLVVLGFSVHDTIVVFDRIRENLLSLRGKKRFGDIINMSVNQTLARSINTSLTLIVVLVALLLWGPGTLFYFLLALLFGVVSGMYSSIFVASPLLYVWHKISAR